MLATVAQVGSALTAHQGGWDEILLVAGPILVIVALLAVAKRRVDRLDATDDPAERSELGADGVHRR